MASKDLTAVVTLVLNGAEFGTYELTNESYYEDADEAAYGMLRVVAKSSAQRVEVRVANSAGNSMAYQFANPGKRQAWEVVPALTQWLSASFSMLANTNR